MNNLSQTKDGTDQTPENRWSNSVWFHALFVAALVLGIFFRFSGLGNKMYSHDEAYTSVYAAGYRPGFVFTSLWNGKDMAVENIQTFLKPGNDRNIAEVLRLLALYSPHQAPLFFSLEHYWMSFMGHTPAAMRGLAAIFGCLSLLAMFWLSREFFQVPATALISTTLFALSPFHILFAQDARPYSLWTLTTLVSSAALLRAIKNNKVTNWVVYSASLILGIYSHQLFALVAVAQAIYFIGVFFKSHNKTMGGFLFACLFALLSYTPWIYLILTRWRQVTTQVEVLSMQTPWYRFVQRWVLLFSSPLIDLDFKSDTLNLAPYFLRVLTLLLVTVAFLYLLKHGPAQEKSFILLIYLVTAGTFIALDLIFGGIRSTTGRYFVPANIATILVVAYYLNAKIDLAGHNTIEKWKILLGLLMMAGVFSNLNSLYSDTWWNKELGRVRIEFIQEINHDETLLIVSGNNATNLGDVLLLGFELDQDVHLTLLRNPADIEYAGNYSNIYWLPSSYREMQEISAQQQLHVREVLPGMLWQIEETSE